MGILKRLSALIGWCIQAVFLLLGFRCVITWMGQQSAPPFTLWILQLSEPMVMPFKEVLLPLKIADRHYDLAPLLAIVVFALFLYMASALGQVLVGARDRKKSDRVWHRDAPREKDA